MGKDQERWVDASQMKLIGTTLLSLLLLPVAGAAQSQTPTATIEGTVIDSSGARIAGAKITAIHETSGLVRATGSDSAGQFRFTALPIGRYSLQVEQNGFTSVRITPFLVSVGQTVTQRIEMKPGEIFERLEVNEQPEALDVTATNSSVALGHDRIEEAPAQNRNCLNFVLIAPNVAPSNGANTQRAAAGIRNASNGSGFTFGGMPGRNNSLMIDGVDNRDETTGGNRVAIGLEMVQEFRVSGTAIGAEFGGAAGGMVNMVTRSGTNIWHGDATFFTQNERLNARNPESLSSRRPRFRRYQPGLSINGPLRPNRTFFATAVEQEWESSEEWSETFANLLGPINQALQWPDFANAAVRSVERGLFPANSQQAEFSFKLNHQVTSAHSLSARYAFSRGRLVNDVQGVENFGDRSSRGSSLTRDHSLVADWVFVITPHWVNDLRGQIARRRAELTPNVRGAMLEIPGQLTLGQSFRLDGVRTEDHYELVETVYASKTAHQLSFGGSVHAIRLDAQLANRFGGIFLFPTPEHFLRAQPDVFIQAFGRPETRFSTFPLGLWLHDRWQTARGLTIEAGLRYDRQEMPKTFFESNRNFAPRLGLAWRPGNNVPLVLRAGYGLFFDRYPLAFLNDALQKDGKRAAEQYLTREAASRALAFSAGGSLSAPLPGFPLSTYTPDSYFPATYSQKATCGAEASLDRDTTLSFESNWIRGIHLPRIRNSNVTLPPLYQLEQSARSSYRGASVTLHRRMSQELSYLVAYNLGRTRDDASDFDEHPLDPLDFGKDWARSRQHQTHRISASGLFELPAEKFHRAPEWLRDSFEHVSVAPILTAGSGRPLNSLDTTDSFRAGAYPLSARPLGLGRNPFLAPGPKGERESEGEGLR
jgi:hypothetical protein